MLDFGLLLLSLVISSTADPAASFNFNYHNVKDDIYEQPVNFMAPRKSAHVKEEQSVHSRPGAESWPPHDFSKFDAYLDGAGVREDPEEHNRIKRHAKRRRPHGGARRRTRPQTSTQAPDEGEQSKNSSTSESPKARRADSNQSLRSRKKKRRNKPNYSQYEPPVKKWEAGFVEMPKDLYQAHLRPGVIFRIHMSEAILKMQYRNYGEDKDESVIEADVEYLRLTRKVINDEITKFEDLKWLAGWFNNRSELIQEHMCNNRYRVAGTPPTMFTHSEEYMKRMCLFDNVYLDHIPYVIGEDSSLMAAVAPPVLHCDAATCTSVPFIDSLMFDEHLPRTNVRTVTRCQASCRAHCRNDPDCLKRCSDRCLRAE